MYNDYLAHHGILGMKWGVRRYRNEDGTLTEAGKRRYQNPDGSLTKAGQRQARRDIRRERKNAYKNRALLSDKELNDRVNRLQREKMLKDLSKTELAPGRSSVGKTLGRYGNQIAGIIIGAAAGQVAKKGIKAAMKYFETRSG